MLPQHLAGIVLENVEKAMVGDLGKSLWLREIIDSVYREKRPLCHIILVKQNEKPT